MVIVSVEDAENPLMLSFTNHFISRDPVVVSGDRAYVTLRSSEPANGTEFVRGVNELQIYDVRNLDLPMQLSSFQMTNPWGLGVQYKKAFICDGSMGLRILSVEDPQDISELAIINTDICFDVITTPSRLISTGLSGINQYKIEADTPTPVLLSTIELAQPN
jgi:hypothetical protein